MQRGENLALRDDTIGVRKQTRRLSGVKQESVQAEEAGHVVGPK